MPRLARIVAPGFPHHVTQRGNRRLRTFFCDEDHEAYIALMREWCDRFGVQVWAYCLMPNHVHLIAVPTTHDGMRRAIGVVHLRAPIGATRGASTSVSAGAATCGRGASPPTPWTRNTC